jgi:hypothetical protein
MHRYVLPRRLGIPNTWRPRPSQATVSNARRGARKPSVKWAELPLAVANFLGFDIPDVIALGFSLLAILVEP